MTLFIRTTLLLLLFAAYTTVQAETLVVGISIGYPPYYYEDEGTLTGFCIETINAVADAIGVDVEYEVYPWKRLIANAQKGDIDAIMPLFKTEQREKYLIFEGLELAPETNHFFTSTESDISFTGNLEDFKQYQIGVVDLYSYGTIFDHFEFPKKQVTRSDKHLIDMFTHHRFDIGVGNRYVVQHYAKLRKIEHTIKFLDPPITKETLYLGVVKARNENNRAEKLAKALQTYKTTPAYRDLIGKYGIIE
ncbi:substrate-binding periplasmic protein [Desulforhopalus sp. 52FAK]